MESVQFEGVSAQCLEFFLHFVNEKRVLGNLEWGKKDFRSV